jgi:uncharacterized membrane protein YkgB
MNIFEISQWIGAIIIFIGLLVLALKMTPDKTTVKK